ncbi:NAC domain-containing protein 35 [Sesamum alatum]|uniref:NAC domain-containing protein 35 n=1 Tax=Sesamum alatum TaxID=300844 RepID=A0AAE2CJH6_9LAMI|nr:NAC domain-containing protein 35 [Sesamum alatum]
MIKFLSITPDHFLQAEISLCRVYKRAGVEDHPSLPRSLPTRSSTRIHHEHAPTTQRFQPSTYVGSSSQQNDAKMTETSPSSSSTDNMNSYTLLPNIPSTTPSDNQTMILLQSRQPNCPSSDHAVDDLHKLVNANTNYQRQSLLINNESTPHHHHDHYNPNNNIAVPDLLSNFSTLQPQAVAVNVVPAGSFQAAFSDRLWEWPEAGKDYAALFK